MKSIFTRERRCIECELERHNCEELMKIDLAERNRTIEYVLLLSMRRARLVRGREE